jgi:hypothetical protein
MAGMLSFLQHCKKRLKALGLGEELKPTSQKEATLAGGLSLIIKNGSSHADNLRSSYSPQRPSILSKLKEKQRK